MSSNFAPSGIYTADVTKYQTPDGIEKANKLLDEAGFPRKEGGMRFEIVHDITPYGPEWQRFGEVVQQQLAKIGIKATLRYEDVATWLKRVYTDYDFFLTSNFLYNLPDPVIGRAPRHPRQADQAGHRVRQRLAVEQSPGRRADGQGDRRARSQEARASTTRRSRRSWWTARPSSGCSS